MYDFVITISILIILYLLVNSARKSHSGLKSPPSPFKLPIIGHLHLVAKHHRNPWKRFDELANEYGEIFQLQLGQCKYTILAGAEVTKEALVDNGEFCLERPALASFRHLLGGQQNSFHMGSWSKLHRNNRKIYSIHTLTGSSLRLEHLDKASNVAIRKFFMSISSGNSTVFITDFLRVYSYLLLDYFCGTNFQSLKDYRDDMECQKFFRAIEELHHMYMNGLVVDVFPSLRNFEFLFPSLKKIEGFSDLILNFLEQEVGLLKMRDKLKEKLANSDVDEKDLNFAELMIKHHLEDPENFPWMKCLSTIDAIVANFALVSFGVMTFLANISLYREHQQKIFQEIINKIHIESEDHLISLEDAKKLIHLAACRLEVVRMISLPFIPRLTTKDIVLKDYHIPKGTTLLVNSYSLNYSSTRWESPEKFMPERFIITEKVEGGLIEERISKPSDHIPYSIGRRACPGNGLAENLTVHMIANLIYRFEISTDLTREEMVKKGLTNAVAYDEESFFSLKLTPRAQSCAKI